MLVDAHAHLHGVEDIDKTLTEAYQSGVRKIMAVSMDMESYQKTCSIHSDRIRIFPALGIHPWNAPSHLNELERALDELKNVKYVGEIGLDHSYYKDAKDHAAQLKVFTAFLEACKGTNKVVNIHSAGAEEQILEMLQSYNVKHVNIHWYDAAEQGTPLKLIPKMIDLGYYISITPMIATSKNAQELTKMVPIDNLLTETDTHPLVKYDGVQSAPKMVKISLEGIARVKNCRLDELEDAVAKNFAQLVG